MLRCLLIYMFLVFAGQCHAQSADSMALVNSDSVVFENCHLHLDKSIYLPGETIWFKAYLSVNGIPSEASTNLYTELYNNNGQLLERKTCPVRNGTADGSFSIPDSADYDQLLIRAWTNSMLRFDSTLFYSKLISLIPFSEKNSRQQTDNKKMTELRFFPEGGDLVEGVENLVAFKAMDQQQFPVKIQGVVKDDNGVPVTLLNPVHDGMGSIKFIPEAGRSYTAFWNDADSILKKTDLPAAKKEGITLHLEQLKEDVYFVIQSPSDKAAFNTLHMIAFLNRQVLYNAVIDMSGDKMISSGKMPVKGLPAGILQATLYDANWRPCAERIIFINRKDIEMDVSLRVNEKNTGKRGKNIIEIEVGDTTAANLSLAITDASFASGISRSPGMIPELLLTGDIRGYVPDPDYYFSSGADSLDKKLDLVMLTHGWRRYKPSESATLPLYDNYISLNGTINQDPGSDMVTIILKDSRNNKQFYTLKPDTTGRFYLTGLLFYDSAWISCSLSKLKNLNDKIKIVSSDGYTQAHLYARVLTAQFDKKKAEAVIPDSAYAKNYLQLLNRFNPAFESKGKQLSEVVVSNGGWHNWRNDPLLKMDEKYTSGIFRGGATARSLDLLNDPMTEANGSLFNYLTSRLPLVLNHDKTGAFLVESRENPRLAKREMLDYYIDESIAYEEQVEQLPITQVAYVKYYPKNTFITSQSRGGKAVIAIFRKKAGDFGKDDAAGAALKRTVIYGYPSPREFFSPDYSNPEFQKPQTDLRTTLYWQPYLITDARNRKLNIEFWNNDFTKKIHIVLEGMNQDGKLVHIEKDIE